MTNWWWIRLTGRRKTMNNQVGPQIVTARNVFQFFKADKRSFFIVWSDGSVDRICLPDSLPSSSRHSRITSMWRKSSWVSVLVWWRSFSPPASVWRRKRSWTNTTGGFLSWRLCWFGSLVCRPSGASWQQASADLCGENWRIKELQRWYS